MDVSTLATGLTAVLAPALPYLVTVGEKAVEALGERLGGEAWDRARAVWERLRGPVEQDPPTTALVQELAATPDDEDARTQVQLRLKKLLGADPPLAEELARLLEGAGQGGSYRAELHGSGAIAQGAGAVAAGEGGVAVGGSVQGDVRVGGDPSQREDE